MAVTYDGGLWPAVGTFVYGALNAFYVECFDPAGQPAQIVAQARGNLSNQRVCLESRELIAGPFRW